MRSGVRPPSWITGVTTILASTLPVAERQYGEDRADVVENFDLLAPEGYGEIIGGSMREDELDRLLQRMDEEHLPREPYEWYLDLRRYGSVPHAGFGMGVERTLAWLCGLKHIREAIAFPRMMDKLYP